MSFFSKAALVRRSAEVRPLVERLRKAGYRFVQMEMPDNWLRYGNPWEFGRQEHLHKIRYHGRVVEYAGEKGEKCWSWTDTHDGPGL